MDPLSPSDPNLPQPLVQPPFPTPIPSASVLYEPNQDERTFAILAHALQMPGWWIAPLIILLTKSYSRFVKFHALQALLLQIVHAMVYVIAMAVWFGFIFSTLANGVTKGNVENMQPPFGLIAVMPLIWLAVMGMYVLILVLTIMYSIKAGKGEWAGYPVLGTLARYMLNF